MTTAQSPVTADDLIAIVTVEQQLADALDTGNGPLAAHLAETIKEMETSLDRRPLLVTGTVEPDFSAPSEPEMHEQLDPIKDHTFAVVTA